MHFAPELFALAALDAPLFLGRRGHAHHRQRLGVAADTPIQSQRQLPRVGLVVVDPGVPLVETDRLADHVLHAPAGQLPMQRVAERTGFVATVHGLRQSELLLDPGRELLGSETLGRFGTAVIDDADHHDRISMHVQAELDAGVGLRRDLLCAGLRVMSVV